ncbi:arginase [Pseudohalocynthiibacter aestuariivivens]|uniref:Arginase n=1 Tax=Roseovarius pelagicus TaxID=2980108 RepID=A0ABY6DC76_9RHOB|nr:MULTISPECIES: arginase [Rhodobacterales]QIE44321.1 arginase [Pseudohalocynthiibacter aestuariivivens]UXX83762.1 arginase [Roseovarius pelagicus]
MTNTCILVGAPMDSGKRRQGCRMGPDAYRVAGIAEALGDLGLEVRDTGNVSPDAATAPQELPNHVFAPDEMIGWTSALARAAEEALPQGIPIFLGGDHALALGTVLGAARHAASQDRPLFVLWLDAHTDYHTPQSTESGNLHGSPLGYVTGRDGFHGFPEVTHPVPHENICLMGLRSVDPAERDDLQQTNIRYHDMRSIDETGIARPLETFLRDVAAANGMLHVSLDVDFLDPGIAPAVGTTVPGGATMREAHLVMEMICDSGLMTSLDLVELNPFLDDRGRTAQVMVDLAASAMGRRVFDRPTRAYS